MKYNTTRQSGIELLRIVAIFGVIMIHFYEKAGHSMPWINNQILILCRTISSASVVVFLIISGYFMCKSYNRYVGKTVDLILQVSCFNELAYLIYVVIGIYPLQIRHIVSSAVPDCYYAILFVALYLISPYINKLLNSLTHKERKIYLSFMAGLFSVYAIGVDLFGEISGKDWMGLSTIGAWGSQSGFTIVNFILCYCIGAYLRLNGIPKFLSKNNKYLYCVISVLLIFMWTQINQKLSIFGMQSSWQYHNPIVILYVVTLFVMFKDMTFSNKFVNRAAKVVYPLFLIHCTVIGKLPISEYCQKNIFEMLLYYFAFSISMYVMSWIVFSLYDFSFRKILERLNRVEIIYFENKK